MRSPEIAPLLLIGALTCVALTMWLWRGTSLHAADLNALAVSADQQPTQGESLTVLRKPLVVPKLPARAVQNGWQRRDGKAVLVRPDQSTLELTLRPDVQQDIGDRLARLRVPYAAVVLIKPGTGAIEAWVEHREISVIGRDKALGLAGNKAPAASIFKIISAAALLEAGVDPKRATCFRGGLRNLRPTHLEAPKGSSRCETLGEALGRSSNAVFGQLTAKHLKRGDLVAKAEDFLFRSNIPFDISTVASTISEGDDTLRRAQTAAGLRGSTLSPLHGALIAATIANDGVMMRPHLVVGDSLQAGLRFEPAPLHTAVAAKTAREIRKMMVRTVRKGTAKKSFEPRPPSLAGFDIAGKTGTLSNKKRSGYRLYSWFVGFAPADKPEIAVAALAVNGRAWRAKGATIARDALDSWFRHRAANKR